VVNTPKTPVPIPTCAAGKQLEPDQELSIEGWSPDGRSILGRVISTQEGTQPSTARVWDGTTGAQKFVLAHPDQVTIATWSPDGRRIMTVDEQGAIRIWDAATGRQLQTWQEKGDVADADWSPDSQRLATAAGNALHVWDVNTGKLLQELHEQTGDMQQAVWSPDGALIAAASSEFSTRVWDARTGSEVVHLQTPKGIDPSSLEGGMLLEWSRDSHRLLASWPAEGVAGSVQVWDAQRHSTRTFAGLAVVSPAISPDGRQIVTMTTKDQRIHLWDATTGQETHSFPAQGEDVQPEWSQDGQHILATGKDDVRLWNAATGQQAGSLRAENGDVTDVVDSPDGQRIILLTDQGMRIWSVATKQDLGSVRGEEIAAALWSPDGRRIVTSSTAGLAHFYADPFTNGRQLEFPDYRSHCVDSNG
jgi:WD40 repeat protein